MSAAITSRATSRHSISADTGQEIIEVAVTGAVACIAAAITERGQRNTAAIIGENNCDSFRNNFLPVLNLVLEKPSIIIRLVFLLSCCIFLVKETFLLIRDRIDISR
jgi:hypothetical protein